VVLPLENKMAYPEDLRGWNGVLNTAMVLVSCLYIAVGFFGYLKYGESVQAAITLNLPVHEWLAQIIILMFSVAIFISYALQFYVPIEILLPVVRAWWPNTAEWKLNYGMRAVVVLFTCEYEPALTVAMAFLFRSRAGRRRPPLGPLHLAGRRGLLLHSGAHGAAAHRRDHLLAVRQSETVEIPHSVSQ